MKKHYRTILVGCGGMSRGWLSAIRDYYSEVCEIVGFVDLYAASAGKLAQDFGHSASWTGTSLVEAIEATKAEVVFNCTIPEAHVETCLTALSQGCHVLVEKPLAPSVAESRELIAAADAAGKCLAVIQNRRYLGAAIAARNAVESGAIGKLHTVNVDFYLAPHFPGFRETMAHPLLLDMSIHTFDQARFLSGIEAESVFCLEHNPGGSWYSNGASATAVFQMSDGVVFNYRGSWCAQGLPTSWQGVWRLIGDLGTLTWDGESGLVLERVTGKREEKAFIQPVECLALSALLLEPAQIGHAGNIGEFLACLESGTAPQTRASDNILSLAMVEAAVLSAERKALVNVREI